MDPYAVLGVARGAGLDEIKSAYRRLSKLRHPDLGGSTEEMAQLNLAWEQVKQGPRPEPRPAPRPEPPSPPVPLGWVYRTMPFGKYKGQTLGAIAASNLDYLRWLLANADGVDRTPGLRSDLMDAVEVGGSGQWGGRRKKARSKAWKEQAWAG